DYILSELNAIEPDLKNFNALGSTRFTKGAAWAIKAKLYLNKAVYLDPYASEFNFTEEDMDKVVENCNKIINSGEYALETDDYFNIFNIDNHNHPEIIFGLDQRLEANGTNRFEWFALSRNTHGSLK